MESKTCSICKNKKPLSNFYSQKKYSKNRGEYIYHNPECKQCTKEKATEWRKDPNNREKFLANRKRMNSKERQKEHFRIANEKRRKEGYHKRYYYKNPDKFQKYNLNRRMNKTHEISDTEWFECLDYFNNSCAYCGITEGEAFDLYGQLLHKEHVDHFGVNDITNCVPACKGCNSQKWEYELNEWYNEDNPIYNKRRYNKIIKWLLSFTEDAI